MTLPLTNLIEMNIYQTYTQKTGALITPWIADQLDYLVEDYELKNVIVAIKKAAEYKKSNIKYIEAILRNMEERGELQRERKGSDYADWND